MVQKKFTIEYRGQKGDVTAYEQEGKMIYRVSWEDYSVDVLSKTIEGQWEDHNTIHKKHRSKIGKLIDEELNRQP